GSVETITSVALMTATAGPPFLSFRRLTEEVLMRETMRCPPPISMTTSLITDPRRIDATLPLNWLRALRAMGQDCRAQARNIPDSHLKTRNHKEAQSRSAWVVGWDREKRLARAVQLRAT